MTSILQQMKRRERAAQRGQPVSEYPRYWQGYGPFPMASGASKHGHTVGVGDSKHAGARMASPLWQRTRKQRKARRDTARASRRRNR